MRGVRLLLHGVLRAMLMGGMFQFDAPADGAETLPAILISPGFSHVSMERV